MTFSQDYTIVESDWSAVLSNRGKITYFSDLIKFDSTSKLQILFVQFDNPKRGKAESYYFKVDSNNCLYRYTFTVDKIIKETIDTNFSIEVQLQMDTSLHDISQSVIQTSTVNGISSPTYLEIKYSKFDSKYYFLHSNIEKALNAIPSLHSAKDFFEYLRKSFNIKINQVLDG